MMQSIHSHATRCVVATIALLCIPFVAQAGTINIILSDMDVSYLGSIAGPGGGVPPGAFFDTMGGYSGGNMMAANADDLSSATFEFDMAPKGTLVSAVGLHGDLKIDGMGATIPKNSFQPTIGNNGGGFGFDFFDNVGHKLQLGITNISLFLSDGVLFFTGTGTVNLATQNLPFGLKFTESTPVYFSYTATAPAVPAGTAPVNSAMGSGAFTISGTGIMIPEPASALGFMIGAALLGVYASSRPQCALSL